MWSNPAHILSSLSCRSYSDTVYVDKMSVHVQVGIASSLAMGRLGGGGGGGGEWPVCTCFKLYQGLLKNLGTL